MNQAMRGEGFCLYNRVSLNIVGLRGGQTYLDRSSADETALDETVT